MHLMPLSHGLTTVKCTVLNDYNLVYKYMCGGVFPLLICTPVAVSQHELVSDNSSSLNAVNIFDLLDSNKIFFEAQFACNS